MPQLTPPKWFAKELKLIRYDLEAVYSDQRKRWAIFQGGEINRWVEDDNGNARPLDRRVIRKLKVDFFFTVNPDALDPYIDEDAYAMLAYTERGLNGLSDYLAGY